MPRPVGGFPWATLTVNVVGCFLFGVTWALAEQRKLLTPDQRAFIASGFLGGFTTFSSFGYETVEMIRAGYAAKAGLHVAVQNILGPLAVLFGHRLSS